MDTRPRRASSPFCKRKWTTNPPFIKGRRCLTCNASPGMASPCTQGGSPVPASHGCVRLPEEFAEKLYAVTIAGRRLSASGGTGTAMRRCCWSLTGTRSESRRCAPCAGIKLILGRACSTSGGERTVRPARIRCTGRRSGRYGGSSAITPTAPTCVVGPTVGSFRIRKVLLNIQNKWLEICIVG